MIAKGIENADAIIAACKTTISSLDSINAESKEVLESIVDILENMKTKFFLKTNLAVPITNAVRKNAVELQSLAEKQDLSSFPNALSNLRSSMEKLLKEASMDGLIIT